MTYMLPLRQIVPPEPPPPPLPKVTIDAYMPAIMAGANMQVSGKVTPGHGVNVGVSATAKDHPAAWEHATVTDEAWNASVIPAAPGTFYVWAMVSGHPEITAVSGAVTVT